MTKFDEPFHYAVIHASYNFGPVTTFLMFYILWVKNHLPRVHDEIWNMVQVLVFSFSVKGVIFGWVQHFKPKSSVSPKLESPKFTANLLLTLPPSGDMAFYLFIYPMWYKS